MAASVPTRTDILHKVSFSRASRKRRSTGVRQGNEMFSQSYTFGTLEHRIRNRSFSQRDNNNTVLGNMVPEDPEREAQEAECNDHDDNFRFDNSSSNILNSNNDNLFMSTTDQNKGGESFQGQSRVLAMAGVPKEEIEANLQGEFLRSNADDSHLTLDENEEGSDGVSLGEELEEDQFQFEGDSPKPSSDPAQKNTISMDPLQSEGFTKFL